MVGTAASSVNDDGLHCAIGLFDQIDDLLLDFPHDHELDFLDIGSEEPNINNSCPEVLLPPPPPPAGTAMLWPSNAPDHTIVSDMLFDDDADHSIAFCNNNNNSSCFNTNTFPDELLHVVSYEDIVQLDWLSSFVADSFSAAAATGGAVGVGLPLDKAKGCCNSSFTNNHFPHTHSQILSNSPVAVLETSSGSSSSCSCSSGKTVPLIYEKRARSKRPRPATFTPRSTALPQPTSSAAVSETDSVAESRPSNKAAVSVSKPFEAVQRIKRAAQITSMILPPAAAASCELLQEEIMMKNSGASPDSLQQQVIRKCLHCEITKTPQWRAGPMGPKTLCNACGVRYKSGRLFPEYRPAASPAFVPLLHSNSHRKVLEMRGRNVATAKSEAVNAAIKR